MKKLILLLCILFLSTATSHAALLFQDDFESGLLKWNTIHGQIQTKEAFNPLNKALTFTDINSGGDTYTISAFIDGLGPGTYTLEFDYLSPDSPYPAGYNGGGFVGIDPDGIKGGDHTWLLGTLPYGGVTYLPDSNNTWVSVSHTFSTSYSQIHLMIEDFYSPAGDAYFDNFKLYDSSPIPEPTTMFLLGTGLVGLAGFRKRSRRS